MSRDNRPVAIVTGASRGIGEYIVRHLLDQGWSVAGASRSEAPTQERNHVHYSVDVCAESAVATMVHEVRNRWGRVDACVSCAGVASMNHSLLTNAATADTLLRTNVLGTFLVSRESAKVMKTRRYGRIIAFGSVAAPLKLEGEALYAASKSAVGALMQVMARELASFGITCNTIAPGPVDTDLTRSVPEAKIRGVLRRMSAERMVSMEDITNALDFFLRPESERITGQTLYVGGVA